MLRYKETENIEARINEVEAAVEVWRDRLSNVPQGLRDEFMSRLQISLIYHDAALEGAVLSHSEIKAAIDPTIISDTSLIPSYEVIKHFDQACRFGADYAKHKRKPITLETVLEICAQLHPNGDSPEPGCPYRKDNPLHRLYYHSIAAPEKIEELMTEYGRWLELPETRALHAVERAAIAHHKLMAIFPWAKRTGRTARILANIMLRRENYPIAIIHSIDRQRYYEALRGEESQLFLVYLEAVETSALSEVRVYEEAERSPGGRRRAS